jgi:glycosyltransferase involved in cell wall biosynthesis
VWHSALRELGRIARVRDADPAARRVRADVWMADGHAEPLETDLPVVSLIVEAPWRMPDVIPDIDPEFAAVMERRSRECAARSARIVAPSGAAAAQVAEVLGAPAERIDVVAHGVDVAAFRPVTGAPVEGRYVLFASQLHPRKNLAALRDAMDRLEDSPALVVVGSPAMDRADSADLEAAAFAPLPGGGRVVRVDGPSDGELAALMAGCDAFCLPSLFEGFGLTALEAMACGAPVIVSDRGALPEVVGDAGLVVAPEPEALAAALTRVLGEPGLADRLGAAGRARAAGMTGAHTARGWLASLERAAEGAGVKPARAGRPGGPWGPGASSSRSPPPDRRPGGTPR